MNAGIDLGFPVWVRLTHLFNILFITLLIRSGIEILAAHPKLYLKDNCTPGTEWIRFTPRHMPEEQFWTGKDEQEAYSPWVSLPGGKELGLGRQWHFLGVLGWLLTGLLYAVLLFVTPQWRRLVPTSWDIFPQAGQAAVMYLQLRLPPAGNPFNALQQLVYFAIIFVLAPLQIATGLAMAPSVAARFPWYVSLFGGRQAARSLHFLGLVAFVSFIVHHVTLVVAHGLGDELAAIILGVERGASPTQQGLAIGILVAWLALVAAVNVWATRTARRAPRSAQQALQRVIDPVQRVLLHHLASRQRYPPQQVTAVPRVNGYPPRDEAYESLADEGFAGWALEVRGLVEQPLRLTLGDLAAMERQTQVTKHNCIQGWSYVAAWTGVPLRTVLERCRPLPAARYVVLHAMDNKSESEPDPEGPGYFYETIDLELARDPQTLLADEMNGERLSVSHGAPLRVRVETQLGFKMVKWLRAIELVEDYKGLGEGQGGWREDWQHYSQDASI
jgi:DMSO/TMAO reductase YedYZ molybdopterin-dependent catalytic subunit/thiosulfate reductase cytochrome b subunit